jgi:hypothetical protein
MAAKKRRASKKKVTIEIDLETLQKLVDAANALSEVVGGFVIASDDPRARRLRARKGAKKGRRR